FECFSTGNAAHGYLLSEFLSPYMNHRKDEWGGTTENRFRIISEIYRRACEQIGDYPILIKINGTDARPGGMRINEAVKISKLLDAFGCAAIEISCGVDEDPFDAIRSEINPIDAVFHYSFKIKSIPWILRPMIKPFLRKLFDPKPLTRLYNVPASNAVKKAVNIPVIVVGGIKTLKDIQLILDNNHADIVSMSRPLIMEPNLVYKFKDQKQTEAKCIGCNYCALALEEGKLKCHHGKISGK
ncbi:MAG: tRNA-dihydrouridine synthase, partial [Oligoflexales bacterium]|nr:tRNA-dihydrouridine synthase [Oligoflexales bacterium]